MPATPGLASGVDLFRAVFAGLMPCAVGVRDGAALDFHYPNACIGHENDQVDFDVAVGVVVQAQAGNEDIVFGEVALDGFADLPLGGGLFGNASGDVTSHDLPHSLSNVSLLSPEMIIPLRNDDAARPFTLDSHAMVSAPSDVGARTYSESTASGYADREISTLGGI